MLIRRVAVENVRSFLDRAELKLDGPITIVIGPNGGGKTNLLDTVVIILRRYLFASMYAIHNPTPESPNRHEFRANDALNSMVLEKHSAGADRAQLVELEIEVTQRDIENMKLMKSDAERITELASKKYISFNLKISNEWALENISSGMRFIYRYENGGIQHDSGDPSKHFLEYLKMFELDGRLRDEFELAPLAMPMVYLPINRTATGFQSNVELASYNEYETKRHSDAASSRSASSIVNLAVGRLAQRFRLLLEKDKGIAATEFRDEANLKELTKLLGELGYDWSLETINPLKNQYDLRLSKQGSSFLVGAASSGERELLTYLFAIFALNVRDAIIIVDEPELHLHPKWQKILLHMFIRLAESTGNQFLLATHSPTFVSPDSIQYVSRVFSQSQRSHILRLNTTGLPEAKHLLNIVNSQNNERLFFADEVILVEGISDRIFFEALLDRQGRSNSSTSTIEVIDVGGKGFFEAYSKVLRSCEIPCSIVSDLDYIEQVGTSDIKALFKTDVAEIKTDVIENIKSQDAEALVKAIDKAIENGNWGHAEQTWDYIKSRRRQLRKDLNDVEKTKLDAFLASKRSEKVYILSQGQLESYLPNGHGSKDIDKLIRLLALKDFWERLPEKSKPELEIIAKSILRHAV